MLPSQSSLYRLATNKPFQLACVILLVSLAFYLRIERFAHRELWHDETYQIQQSSGPFKAFWARNTYGDMTCFPGDYLLTYPFIRVFGADNKWGMAIPHIFMTLLSFYFLFRICQRYFKTALGYIVTFLVVAVNQHLIFHSFEIRPYAALPALALGSFYFLDILFDPKQPIALWKKVLMGLFLFFVMCFHAFGIIIVFIPLSYFILSNWREILLDRAFQQRLQFLGGVWGIGMVVWLWYALGNPLGFNHESYAQMNIQTFTYIPNPLDGFRRFFNYTVFYHLIGAKTLNFLLGALVFMLFVPYAGKLKMIGFFLIAIILPIQFILLVDLHNNYWFLIRQYIYLAPFLAFFLGWLWDATLYYYLDSNLRKKNFLSTVGFILMMGCFLSGGGNAIAKLIHHPPPPETTTPASP